MKQYKVYRKKNNHAIAYRGGYSEFQFDFPSSLIPSASASAVVYGSQYGNKGNIYSLLGTSKNTNASAGIFLAFISQSTNNLQSRPNGQVTTFGLGLGLSTSRSIIGVSSGNSNTNYYHKLY